MNKALLDPFVLSQEFPESLNSKYNWGQVACFKFSSSGDYAAAGLLSGVILIIDTDTWSPICELVGHSDCIVSLKWSQDGDKIISGARDMHVFVWDVHKRSRTHKILIGSTITCVAIGPADDFVVNIVDAPPLYFPGPNAGSMEPSGPSMSTKIELPIKKSAVAAFFDDGSFIIGESTGILSVFKFDPESRQVGLQYSHKLCSSKISEILIKDNKLYVTSQDKSIRVVEIQDGEFTVATKIIDKVNGFHWFNMVTTPTAEFIMAVPMEQARSIYMWESATGRVEHIYECPEEVLGLDFHPLKALLLATGVDTGTAYVWDRKFKQEWGALAPDFVELVQNEYYYEQEEEFDILNEDPDTFKTWPPDRDIDIYDTDVPVSRPIFG